MGSIDRQVPDCEAELLRGGGAGFAQLYRRLEEPLLRYFLRRAADPDVAADLTAETFARAWERRDRFDPERGQAAPWVFGIARNVLLDSLRRGQVDDRTRRRLGMERLVLDDAALARVTELNSAPALAALADLPSDQRTAVQGRVLDERSYEELAAGLRCSESVVRKRVSRGLRALHLKLKESTTR